MAIPAVVGLAAAGLPNLGDQANAVLSGTITGLGPTPAFAFRGGVNMSIWDSVVTTMTTTAGSLSATVASATGLAAGNTIKSTNLPSGSTIGALSGTAVTLALAPRTHQASIAGNLLTMAGPTDRLLGATVTVPSNNEGVVLPAGTTVAAVLQASVAATNNNPGTPGILQLSAAATTQPANSGPVPFQFALTGNGVVDTGADATASFTGSSMTFSATVELERSFDGGRTWIICNVGSGGLLAIWNAGTPVSLTFQEAERQVLYRLNCTAYASGTINYRFSQTGGAAESLAVLS